RLRPAGRRQGAGRGDAGAPPDPGAGRAGQERLLPHARGRASRPPRRAGGVDPPLNASRVLSLLLFVVCAALATGWPLLFNLIYLLVGLLVLSWVWSRLGLAWLDLHRQ